MKKKNILRDVMLIFACLWTWSAKATTVSVMSSGSGIKYSNYIAYLYLDGSSSTLGFYKTGENVYFRGAKTQATSLVVPDSIIISQDGSSITYAVEWVGYNSYYSDNYCDFSESPNLTSIELPSVMSVSNGAFYNCSGLTSISLPKATSIGSYAFYGCSALEEIILSSLETVSYEMFRGFTSLKSVDLSSATSINDYAFQGCTSLTSISLPMATSIGSDAFYNCSNLISISLPKATSIGYGAFANCSNLTSILLPSVTEIGSWAFEYCNSLKSISLPASATISSSTFSGLNSAVDLFLQGDSVATWDPNWLPSNTNVVWVAEANIDYYKEWTVNNGIDVRYEGWQPKITIVTENTTGQLAQNILRQVAQWTDVEALVVTGHLNESDMKYLSQMTCLRQIDLSGTDITNITGCSGLKMLSKILLPQTLTTVDDNAFAGCSRLDSLSLTNVKTIGDNSFSDCFALSNIEMPLVTKIGHRAFYYCSALTDVPRCQVESVDMQAFEGCTGLTNLELPSLKSIGDRAFSYCINLKTVSLPATTTIGFRVFMEDQNLTSVSLPLATTIDSYAFSRCYRLKNVEIPVVVSLGSQVFERCDSLTSITLPETLQFIGGNCFNNCYALTDIYCHVSLPFTTTAFTSMQTLEQTTLHVPAFGIMSYQMNADWNIFKTIVPLDGEVKKVFVSTDATIMSTIGLSEKSEWLLGYAQNLNIPGHLTVNASSALDMGQFVQDIDITDANNMTTLIANSEMTADSVTLNMTVPTGSWQFVSLPFDVNVDDIRVTDGTLWVIRRYSGADRAAKTGNTWQDMTSGSTLQAGEGYILQSVKEDGTSGSVKFEFTAADNEKRNNLFAHGDVQKALNLFESEFAYNSSWNLVGNPYPAFCAINSIGHNGIITAWNGNGYSAYSPIDDQYVVNPFEAFFVQRTDDAEAITFKADGRQHAKRTEESVPSPALHRAHQNRCVYNITLSDDNYTDRTRLVINPEAKSEYETNCDAAKMMSMDTRVPQLYIIDNNIHYAIDERPVGEGWFQLGMRVNATGTYTIALQEPVEGNTTIVLTDNQTGKETDLSQGCYSFTANEGTLDNRFNITLGGDITGISDAMRLNDNAKIINDKYYTIDGKRATSTSQPGIYIVNKNGKNHKVVVTK